MDLKAYKLRRASAGLTLIEMIVACVIIVIMMMAVGMILTSAQRVVKTSEANMRSNNKATALRTVLREDFRRASKLGFIGLMENPTSGPQVFFTTAGPTPSLSGGSLGNGSIVHIGMTTDDPDDPDEDVIFRQGWVMNNSAGGMLDHGDVSWPSYRARDEKSYDFSNWQLLDFYDGAVQAKVGVLPFLAPNGLKTRQAHLTLADITDTNWKTLCTNAKKLTIEWTTGKTDGSGNLEWYSNGSPANDPTVERLLDLDSDGTPETYQAVWTTANQNSWPKAFRIRITIDDPLLPEDFGDTDYEIICPVGQ